MKLRLFILMAAVLVLCTACGKSSSITVIGGADGPTKIFIAGNGGGEMKEEKTAYQQISAKEAKDLMDHEEGYIIIDAREQDEYDEKHIPGAVLMPYESAAELADELLPDKDQMILIYCRSGRRSKIAAETLAGLGYTDIREFGGIIDWPYETESSK